VQIDKRWIWPITRRSAEMRRAASLSVCYDGTPRALREATSLQALNAQLVHAQLTS
jgi:hypothetical protein